LRRDISKNIMVISDRLRAIRQQKDLSQGDIEQRTGLKRCYVSRVENGHTVPSVETLEKLARALEIPMYQLFYDGEAPPEPPALPEGISAGIDEWGSAGESAKFFQRLRQLLGRLSESDRKLIMHMTFQLVRRNRP
jgi:transcriptional regulator with XRE-family HTH domain